MKRIVLGTAGHIDHGKTLLTRALTGVDTDRLAEEKARGITIELGFAPLILPDGTRISLVDVPGHEKFVRTMMAGVTGIDGVLLVIAADDGVMPQTREHLDILQLLNLRRGVAVITKTDIVDEARVEAVRAQVTELVRGTFLENAPIVNVSAATGEGIPALKAEIARMVESAEEKNMDRPLRMAVDRAFQSAGFGTVATGTLSEGTARVGEGIELMPAGVGGTIRTIQNHGADAQTAMAGMRAAMSFSALAVDPERGCTVAARDSVIVADTLTARLQILADCPYKIRNSSQLHLFHGTREQVCKLRLLDCDALSAGESGYAQLKLMQPIPVRWDDRFLLRFFSPVVTVGGGMVLSCAPARLRRNHAPTLERLRRLSDADISVRTAQRIEDFGLTAVPIDRVRRYANLSEAEFARMNLSAIRLTPDTCTGQNAVETALGTCRDILRRFHAQYPLQPGMPVSEWRGRMGTDIADALRAYWAQSGAVRVENDRIALPDFVPEFTQRHKIMQRKILHHYREAWLIAPDIRDVQVKFARFGDLFEQVMANMRYNGMIIPLSKYHWVHFEAYADALRILDGLFAEHPEVTLAEFRTAAGFSRKYAQLFLEAFDRAGHTRRVGDVRKRRTRDSQ